MLINVFRLLNIIFVFIFFSSCDFGEIKSKATTGSTVIAVDENIEPFFKAAEKEFERLNPEAQLDVHYIPTTNVIAELINGQVKTAIATRNFNEEEKKVIANHNILIDSHLVAVDGLAFIVNPENPVNRLTTEDLRKIFTGEYTNWTDINVQDEQQNSNVKSGMSASLNKIKVFIPRRNSYSHDFTKLNMLKNSEYVNSAVVCSTSVQMLEEIRKNKNAIGISNSSWLSVGNQDVLDSTVKPIRVSFIDDTGRMGDFVQFHQGFVFNGNYKYWRVVYLFTTEEGISLITGLTSFLVGTQGQTVVLKQGLVPVTQPVRTIQLK